MGKHNHMDTMSVASFDKNACGSSFPPPSPLVNESWSISIIKLFFFVFFMSTEEVTSPTDLQFFEVSDKKIVLTWTGPAGDVSGYRVTVDVVDDSGTPQRAMTLPISQNSYIEISHLEPGTMYRFNIYTIQNGEESLPLIGEQTTSEYDWLQRNDCSHKNEFILFSFHRETNQM